MTKYLYIIGIFLFSLPIVKGQDCRLKLEVNQLLSKGKFISFNLSIKNISKQKLATYLPITEDVCFRILCIQFVELKSNIVHVYRPCNFYIDLEKAILDSNNVVVLSPGETYDQKYDLDKKDIFPHLKINTQYDIYIKWNFKDIRFETGFIDLFREDIESNEMIFNN